MSPKHVADREFGFLINDVARMLRAEFERRITEANLGLTPGEARALAHAMRAGSARQSVLAERMGLEAMTLSSYLDRLEALGLVSRTTDPSDRRAKIVNVTADADQLVAGIRQVAAAVRVDLIGDMTPEEWERFLDTLARLRETLCEWRKPAMGGRDAAA